MSFSTPASRCGRLSSARRAPPPSLMNDDLYGICNSLPGVNVSGTKNDRVGRENLLANDVISKDIDIERAFEEATC